MTLYQALVVLAVLILALLALEQQRLALIAAVMFLVGAAWLGAPIIARGCRRKP